MAERRQPERGAGGKPGWRAAGPGHEGGVWPWGGLV